VFLSVHWFSDVTCSLPILVGDFVTCENGNINGILSDGGYAEYATLDVTAVTKIPEDIDVALAAPLLCAGVTVFVSPRLQGLPTEKTLDRFRT
jgi:D-arabinose 1-dehydrogenase-like Zn-dependent alcohol dehydrogenase